MKIRNGFVSNSSSTSFCIMGIIRDRDEFISGDPDDNDFIEDLENQDVLDFCDTCGENESYAIGLEMHKMQDDETLLEFKHRVRQALLSINEQIDVESIYLHYGEWYNG